MTRRCRPLLLALASLLVCAAPAAAARPRDNRAARLVAHPDGFLTRPSAQDPARTGLSYVRSHSGVFGLDPSDLARLRLVRRDRSPDGVTHLAYVQTSHGIAAYDNQLLIHVTQGGRLLNVAGPAITGVNVASARPRVQAGQAIATARDDVGGSLLAPPRATRLPGPERPTRFSNGDRARLTLFADGTSTRLAWRVQVTGEHGFLYELVVDARTAEVLARHSLTDSVVSNASVYDNHPGAAVGGTAHTVDLNADPTWLNRSGGFTVLSGNNTHAYADTGGVNGFDAGEDIPPSSGTNWTYPLTPFSVAGQNCPSPGCTWNSGSAATRATNRNQATTQLFYLVNTFHDHLEAAPIGFDHASGNFEFTDADGSGPGLGGDPVNAEAEDSSGTNNANMTTPPDGSPPKMQMFFWTNPSLDGSDSADIVYHEYTHGLTNRLVGDTNGLNANQSGAMGEGWSDWYAEDFLVARGLVADTPANGEIEIAQYLLPSGGLRWEPLDCAVGASAAACPGSPRAGTGGFTYGDLGRVGNRFEVHDDGEIWSQTLWDLRRALGSATAEGLVTGGLRLSPPNPSFLDMRDAILQADLATGGTNRATIWQVFATRGMGFSASTASSAATSAREAFDLPPTPPTPPTLGPAGGTTNPAPGPGAALTAPRASFTGAAKAVRVSANRRFAYSFLVTAGAKGTALFRGGKLTLGRASFRSPATGKVKVTITLSRKNLRKLERLRRLRVKAKVTLAGRTFTGTFTLKPPRRKAAH